MNRLTALKEKLASRQNALGTTVVNVAWSGIVQKLAAYPFDFVVFDIEHGTLNIEGAEELLRVCRLCDLPSIVRVPDCIPNLISKTLDMGADGLILPRVESLQQVETAVRAARYYPRGRKGCGGFSNLRPDDKGSVDTYNDNRLIFVQMESQEGLDKLPQILDRFSRDIAGVLIGPYDTSIMLGTPLNIVSDVMTEFIKKVFAICAERDVSCGSFVDDASMLRRYRDLGGNVFWTGTDLSLYCEAVGNLCGEFARMDAEGAQRK